MKVNERRTVVGGLIGHCVSPNRGERSTRTAVTLLVLTGRLVLGVIPVKRRFHPTQRSQRIYATHASVKGAVACLIGRCVRSVSCIHCVTSVASVTAVTSVALRL